MTKKTYIFEAPPSEEVERIKPGAYRLSEDVANPQPDKRERHDWYKFAVWKKGTRFYAVKSDYGVEIYSGPWSHKAKNTKGLPSALLKALVREEPTSITDAFAAANESSWMINCGIDQLVKEGKLTYQDVIEAAKRAGRKMNSTEVVKNAIGYRDS